MTLIVVAAAVNSSACFLAGSLIAGVGFGVAFLGGLRALTGVIPPEHRAAVMSAFYLVAYSSLSVPVVLAGALVGHLGLDTTFEVFGSVVAAIALTMPGEPGRPPQPPPPPPPPPPLQHPHPPSSRSIPH